MSECIINVNSSNYEEVVLNSNKPVLVDFWAIWCSPCRMQAPILEELCDDVKGKAVIAKVNVDENEALAVKYGIMSIPTLLVFKNGEIVEKAVGLTSRADLASMLIKHL
ncbi:MAG: thioredoxin [Clostridia bacterium]|nr:thioredoxin [Clostridia bacterium]